MVQVSHNTRLVFTKHPSNLLAENKPGYLLYICLLQNLYRQDCKKHHKPRMSLRPTHLNLPDPMNRTINPRYPNMDIGLKLTGVQMTRDELRRMIIHRKKFPTFSTRPTNLLITNHLNIYPFSTNIRFILTNPAVLFNTQSLTINFFNFYNFALFQPILSRLLAH